MRFIRGLKNKIIIVFVKLTGDNLNKIYLDKFFKLLNIVKFNLGYLLLFLKPYEI